MKRFKSSETWWRRYQKFSPWKIKKNMMKRKDEAGPSKTKVHEKKEIKGVWALQHKFSWPLKRIRGRKKFQNPGRSHLNTSIFTCLLSRMGMCIPWFSLWIGRREGKRANTPWGVQKWTNLLRHKRTKSKVGLDVQGIFSLLGCLLIICGATRGNHDI